MRASEVFSKVDTRKIVFTDYSINKLMDSDIPHVMAYKNYSSYYSQSSTEKQQKLISYINDRLNLRLKPWDITSMDKVSADMFIRKYKKTFDDTFNTDNKVDELYIDELAEDAFQSSYWG